ncbi:15011_t:CDS:2 [Dentiscutata erythropus]|uniref:15011_t:CDS:1 n=1 Tax=Dentiscutata erythropus TaxID=1348616 RepID=A0A9N8ZCA3_9GLOM|nr:15011_t:CDS:2 [Dentiscutata erythropus]
MPRQRIDFTPVHRSEWKKHPNGVLSQDIEFTHTNQSEQRYPKRGRSYDRCCRIRDSSNSSSDRDRSSSRDDFYQNHYSSTYQSQRSHNRNNRKRERSPPDDHITTRRRHHFNESRRNHESYLHQPVCTTFEPSYIQNLMSQISNLSLQLEIMQNRISGVPPIQPSSTHASINMQNEGDENQQNETRLLLEAPTPFERPPENHETLVIVSKNQTLSLNKASKLPSQMNNEDAQFTQMPLEPMNSVFKQTFHDEIVKILDHLPTEHQFDITKNFTQQLNHVTYVTIPAVKALISPRLVFTDDELIATIRQLHKSRRGKWKSREKLEAHRARRRISSRTKRKICSRIRGLQHMVRIGDPILNECQPPTLSWEEYLHDLERAVNDPALQSCEESDNDEVLANQERGERPTIIRDSNSVIKVYDKPWRSTKIKRLLRRCDEVGGSVYGLIRKRWYNDQLYVNNNSRPNEHVPHWWVSTNWSTSDAESSEIHKEVELEVDKENVGDNNGNDI